MSTMDDLDVAAHYAPGDRSPWPRSKASFAIGNQGGARTSALGPEGIQLELHKSFQPHTDTRVHCATILPLLTSRQRVCPTPLLTFWFIIQNHWKPAK